MAATGCRNDLRPVESGEDVTDEIVFAAGGRVVLLSDAAMSMETARELLAEAAADALLIAAPGASAFLPPDEAAQQALFGRDDPPVTVEGWLGAFRLGFADKTVAEADIVIDHGRTPAIDRAVPPYGYFVTGGDAAGLREAARAAARLRGRFAKPRYFSYDMMICAHERNGQTGCTRCLDVCDAGAIRSTGTTVEVEPHLCQGCNACMLACPTGALSPAVPSRTELYRQMQRAVTEDGALSVGPSDATPVDMDVPVPAAFGEELWLAALAEGAGSVTLHLPDETPDRERALIEARIAVADSMAQAYGLPSGTVRALAEGEAAPDAAASRGVRDRTAPDTRRARSAPDAQRKRDFVNAALQALEQEHGPVTAPLPAGSPLGAIAVDPAACVMCGICAQTCPTNAIKYDESATDAQLLFAECNCVQCGLCTRICPEHAITLEPRLAPAAQRMAWQPVNAAPVVPCADCGVPLMPEPLLTSIMKRAGDSVPQQVRDQFLRCTNCRHAKLDGSF